MRAALWWACCYVSCTSQDHVCLLLSAFLSTTCFSDLTDVNSGSLDCALWLHCCQLAALVSTDGRSVWAVLIVQLQPVVVASSLTFLGSAAGQCIHLPRLRRHDLALRSAGRGLGHVRMLCWVLRARVCENKQRYCCRYHARRFCPSFAIQCSTIRKGHHNHTLHGAIKIKMFVLWKDILCVLCNPALYYWQSVKILRYVRYVTCVSCFMSKCIVTFLLCKYAVSGAGTAGWVPE